MLVLRAPCASSSRRWPRCSLRLLARHWTEAGETESAIGAWKKAGQAALERCAFMEAEESYRQANALLNRLLLSQTRDRVELELCSGLERVLQVTKGYSAPETMQLEPAQGCWPNVSAISRNSFARAPDLGVDFLHRRL